VATSQLALPHKIVPPTTERPAVKWTLIAVAVLFLAAILLLPLIAVFVQAFTKGPAVFWKALSDPDGLAAIKLTLLVAVISVPLNVIFGVCAAWCIAKFEFKGKAFLITLIDLPF
jgi:sulfate transport system permease protein